MYFTFLQKITKYYRYRILLKTTIQNPTIVNDKKYNCEIIGDGKIHHFGMDIPDIESSHFEINCTKIA